jgi:hypothetical protein
MSSLPMIAKEYAPYHTLPAFTAGFRSYGTVYQERNPYDGMNAQAWDRGLECGMRVARWTDRNVGLD